MQQSLDGYLSDVERHLHTLPPNIRAGEIDEMASHLQQLRADFVASGRTIAEAEALATARFGTARKAGLRLRDVWEGNRGAAVSFAAVVLSNCVLHLANFLAGKMSLRYVTLGNPTPLLREPLVPVLSLWVWWTVLLMPFIVNFALGRWGGRRVALAAPTPHLAWLSLPGMLGRSVWVGADVELPFVLLVVVLAGASTLGAWAGTASKRRSRFAIIGGTSLEVASARLLERQKWHRRGLVVRASTCTLILASTGAGVFAVVKARVDSVLRPPTPEAAVRLMLRYPYGGSSDLEPATNVSLRLLPATSEQVKQGERLVAYTATMHASEEYRREAIAFVQAYQSRAQASHHSIYGTNYSVQEWRDALARLKPEGYTMSRVARVRETSEGWQIVMSGDNSQKPWAWVYDIGYKEPAPDPRA